MANAILEFYNATNGGVTVSSNANSLVFKYSGTHSSLTNRSANSIGVRSLAIITCSPTAIVVWLPRDTNVAWSLYQGFYSYNNGTRYFYFMSPSTAEQLIDYWVFDKPDATNTSDIKFEVYDEITGSLRWQLYTRPMKVVAPLAVSSGGISIPSGRRYAGLLSVYAVKTDVAFGTVDQYRTSFNRSVILNQGSYLDHALRIMDRETAAHSPQRPDEILGIASMLVVDVTGL